MYILESNQNNVNGVIANSFPKSGTPVLTRILSLLGYIEAETHLSRSLILYGSRNVFRNFWISRRIEKRQNEGINIDIEIPDRSVQNEWFKKHINNKIGPGKYVQAHLPYSEQLETIIEELNRPMLYIHRDPRDVLVSLKNYILKLEHHPNHQMLKSLKSKEEQFRILLNGYNDGNNVTTMAPFFNKFHKSSGWLGSKRNCTVSFEKIIGPKGGGTRNEQFDEVEKIVQYLGVTDVNIGQVSENIFDRESETFHKGIIGQWKKEFDKNIMEVYQKHYEVYTVMS